MKRKRELTKARLIKDLNINATIAFGVLFTTVSVGGLIYCIIQWTIMFEKIKLALPILGMIILAFAALGAMMLYAACKDKQDIKNGNFAIFTDAVTRIEPIQTRPSNRVYFDEYTKHCGFGAVELSSPKVKVGEQYLLIKLPSSNFVVLAYPCSEFNLREELSSTLKTPTIALSK